MNLRRSLPGLTPAQREKVAQSMCVDGFCGAADCYRCRGEAALDVLEEELPELFAEESES